MSPAHSPHVDPLLDELRGELADIAPRRGTIPIMSTVTGELCDGSELDAAYWARNLRSPVRFWEATRALSEHGAGVFVELGPHPVLAAAVEQTLEQTGQEGLALPAMRRDQPALETSAELFGTLWANAHPAAVTMPAGDPVRAVPLPAYAWQHQKLWFRRPGATLRPAANARARTAAVSLDEQPSGYSRAADGRRAARTRRPRGRGRRRRGRGAAPRSGRRRSADGLLSDGHGLDARCARAGADRGAGSSACFRRA